MSVEVHAEIRLKGAPGSGRTRVRVKRRGKRAAAPAPAPAKAPPPVAPAEGGESRVKALARVLLVLGLAATGLFLFREVPRDVTLVYRVPEPASTRSLEVDIRRGDATVRHAEFRFPDGAPPQVRHEMRLSDGDYTLAVRLSAGTTAPRELVRSIAVSEEGTIVVPLGSGP